MRFKDIIKFVKRANYGEDILVVPGYDILSSIVTVEEFQDKLEDDEEWCAAIPLLNKDTEEVYKFIICIGTEFYKQHKNKEDMLKFVLLHEVGHVHTYYDDVFDTEDNEAIWELDAQLWAIKRAKEMGLKHVSKKAWENFQKWDQLDEEYRRAKEIYDLVKK
jgi:hypothetical protein